MLPRIGSFLISLIIAMAGVIGLLLFFNAHDRSTFDQSVGPGQVFADQGTRHIRPGQAPGIAYDSNPPTSGPHVPVAVRHDQTTLSTDQLLQALEVGDVVMTYGSPQPPAALRALAIRVAGPFDPALAASGQAVLLDHLPGSRGFDALAWRHLLHVAAPGDGALSTFAEYWLGRGAP